MVCVCVCANMGVTKSYHTDGGGHKILSHGWGWSQNLITRMGVVIKSYSPLMGESQSTFVGYVLMVYILKILHFSL